MDRPDLRVLEDDDIPMIFELACCMTYKEIGIKFDASTETIRKVIQRKRYTHVHIDPELIERAQHESLYRKLRGTRHHPEKEVAVIENWQNKDADLAAMLDCSISTITRYRREIRKERDMPVRKQGRPKDV